MWPFQFRLGWLAAGPVEILILVGIVAAGCLIWRLLRPLDVSKGSVFDFGLGALIGGAIGARLFYFLPLWIRGLEEGSSLVGTWSQGSGFYGGFLGGVAGIALVARYKKLPVRTVLDAVAVGIPIGFAAGKLGCFLAGCCYGVRCESPPGVAFAPGSLAYRTQASAGEITPVDEAALPVHATQLYELSFALLLFGALLWFHRRSRRPGEVMLAYVVGYSLWRFVIEFFRDDPGRDGFAAGISDSQVTALVLLAVAGALWALLRRRPPAAASSPS